MVLQSSQHVVDCPICGRPVEVQSQYISDEIACGHCRGRFVAHETGDDGLTAEKLDGSDSLERAERLLRRTGEANRGVPADRCKRLLQSPVDDLNDDECPSQRLGTLLEDELAEEAAQPTALLVEHRDEVFARIATDMAGFGIRVVRANSAVEALKLFGACQPKMVVANVDLPDQNGWMLAGKIRFIDADVRIWIYQPRSDPEDKGMAKWLEVDELLDFGGDLLGLSETIIDLMADRSEPSIAAGEFQRTQESAVA